jgi:hypothetical protein
LIGVRRRIEQLEHRIGLRRATHGASDSAIAPAAAYAQHMMSHIFSALGMWDELVLANERAVKLEFDALTGQGERSRNAQTGDGCHEKCHRHK